MTRDSSNYPDVDAISNPILKAPPPGLPPRPVERRQVALDRFEESPRPGPEASRPWLAAALLTGIGVLGVGAGLLAPSPMPSQTQVVLLDEFPSGEYTTHGTLVEQVLLGSRNCDPPANDWHVQRFQVHKDDSMRGFDEQRPGALRDYVRSRYLTPIRETTEALQSLIDQGGRSVAGQSQGASESRLVESLFNRAKGDARFRATLNSELGLEGQPNDRELLTKLVTTVHELRTQDRAVDAARQKLLDVAERASEQGIIRVISAGNQGVLHRYMQAEGIAIPDGFFANDLADPQAIIVGASDDRQTVDPADDRVAALASPDAGAIIGADGVDLPLCVNHQVHPESGSSFAQPQVTRAIYKLLLENPNITRDQIVEALTNSARPLEDSASTLGAGIMDESEFLISGRRLSNG